MLPSSVLLHLASPAGEKRDLPVRGLFYGIGHKPNSGRCAAMYAAMYAALMPLLLPGSSSPRGHTMFKRSISPNCCADFLAGQLELDQEGYVVVKHGGKTSVEGVFAAGDLHDVEGRQVG